MKWDRREIKSFRLKYRIETLKNIFEKSNQNALFITLNNYSKNDLKKEFLADSLLLNNISKKAIKYICRNSFLKNLLEGNVILVQNKINNFNYKQIITHKKVGLNFYLTNQQIYRNKEKLMTNVATTGLIAQELNFGVKNIFKTIYLLKKYNQNSIL